MVQVKFSASAFVAIATLAAIADGKLTKLETETAAQNAVSIAKAFNEAVEESGIDETAAKFAKRLLPRAIAAKDGNVEEGCRFAVKCAAKVLARVAELEPVEPGAIAEDDGTVV